MAEVIIFGAGPSGLMAAHAAETAGHEVVKLWDKQPQPPDGKTAGVFYLHQPCGLDIRSQEIKISAEGEKCVYAQRVYGDPNAPCNWPEQPYTTTAWDGMAAVFALWQRYGHLAQRGRVTYHDIVTLAMTERERICINTIPLDALWDGELKLPYSTSQILSTETDLFYRSMPHMTYMGVYSADVTRRSWIFGRYALESPVNDNRAWEQCSGWNRHVVKKVQPSDVAGAIVDTLEQRHPNLLFTGRYGRWDKKMLTHRVYDDILTRLG